MFTVQTRVTDARTSTCCDPTSAGCSRDEARATVAERCTKKPQVQVVVGDGLSAAAVANNLPQIYPVIEQGCAAPG